MKKAVLLITLLASSFAIASGANILALLTIASPSHHIWNSPLLVALANKGHNVTIISSQAQPKPVANLTDLVVPSLVDDVAESYDYIGMTEIPLREWIREVFTFTVKGCELVLDSKEFKALMDYPPDTKYDLVVVESIGCECLFGIIHKFGNPPIVSVNGFQVPIWTLRQSGTPYFPSHMPYLLSMSSDRMTFAERVQNVLYSMYGNYLYYYEYMPAMNKLARRYFGEQNPPVEELVDNVSLVLGNFHPALDYSWARTPTLIPIGGIQIKKEPKPLPADLQKYLDDAKDGAIFFSLGSNVRSDSLSPQLIKQILEAFAEIPQKVLWKFESDLTGIPKNVRIQKWLPQSDILAHPNLKLFISHSGGLSTHETIYRAVPVVSIPILADQFINSQRVVHHGGGVRILFRDLTKDSLLNAIRTVLNNPSYKENMKALSLRFRDNPQSSLESAVFWTEYVIRHNGAKHLRSAALDLNTAQYLLLDVIALLLAVPVLFITAIYCLCCRRKSKDLKKLKKN